MTIRMNFFYSYPIEQKTEELNFTSWHTKMYIVQCAFLLNIHIKSTRCCYFFFFTWIVLVTNAKFLFVLLLVYFFVIGFVFIFYFVFILILILWFHLWEDNNGFEHIQMRKLFLLLLHLLRLDFRPLIFHVYFFIANILCCGLLNSRYFFLSFFKWVSLW